MCVPDLPLDATISGVRYHGKRRRRWSSGRTQSAWEHEPAIRSPFRSRNRTHNSGSLEFEASAEIAAQKGPYENIVTCLLNWSTWLMSSGSQRALPFPAPRSTSLCLTNPRHCNTLKIHIGAKLPSCPAERPSQPPIVTVLYMR